MAAQWCQCGSDRAIRPGHPQSLFAHNPCLLLPPALLLVPNRRRPALAVVPLPPAVAFMPPAEASTPLPPADALPAPAEPPSLLVGSVLLLLPSETGMVHVPVVKVMLMPGPGHFSDVKARSMISG